MGADTGGRASYLKTSLPMAFGATIERDSRLGDQSMSISPLRSLPVLAMRPTLRNHESPGFDAETPKSEYGRVTIASHLPLSRRLSTFHPFPFHVASGRSSGSPCRSHCIPHGVYRQQPAPRRRPRFEEAS